MEKLTKAQERLLREVNNHPGLVVLKTSDGYSYSTKRKMVNRGLIAMTVSAAGNAYYALTELGRAALAKEQSR